MCGRPRVLNARSCGKNLPGAVYVGRPSQDGNPFSIGKHGDREEVLRKYIDWLHDNPTYVEEVRDRLKGKDLICWCVPDACHAEILRDLAAGDPLPERRLADQGSFDI